MEQHTTPPVSTSTQEIDLWRVLQRAGQWGGKVVRSVAVFLLQNIFWLAGFAALGGAIGVTNYMLSTPYYNSTMQLRNNVLNSVHFVNSINNDLMIATEQDLATKLGMPDSLAAQIVSIRACYGVDLNKDGIADVIDTDGRFIASDSIGAAQVIHSSFYVNVRAHSNRVLPYIRESVMRAIANDEYVTLYNEERIFSMTEQLKHLTRQTARLDSLQQFDYFLNEREKDRRTGGSGQLMILNEKDRQLYHNDLLLLNERYANIQSTLTFFREPVVVIEEFSDMGARYNGLYSYLRPAVSFFFALGVLFVLLLRFRKELWRLMKGSR